MTTTATPTHALIPTVDGDLYGMPGVDLIRAVDTAAEWEPVQWIGAPEGETSRTAGTPVWRVMSRPSEPTSKRMSDHGVYVRM